MATSPSSKPDERALLLQFLGSLTLSDHMGDVADDVNTLLDRLGLTDLKERHDRYLDDTDNWWKALAKALHEEGVTTLYGTTLWGEEDEEEEDDD